MNARNYARQGFSLIELMLVLVILATLAVIVVPRFTGKSKQAKVTAAQAEINNLKTALSNFEINTGNFPTEAEGLDALVTDPGNVDGWQGPYLDSNVVPKDPWGNDYIYVCPGKINSDYDLYSKGPDLNENTDDDIGNWVKEN